MLDINLLGACGICFIIGLCPAFFDFHLRIVRTENGTAPISYLTNFHSGLFFFVTGVSAVCLFVYARLDQQGLISKALTVAGDSVYLQAIYCGILVMFLLRSKVIDTGTIKWGPEHYYEIFRLWTITKYKTHAGIIRSEYLTKTAKRTLLLEGFDADIIDMLRNVLNADTKRLKKFNKDLKAKSVAGKFDPNAHKVQYNRWLIGLCIDYIGMSDTVNWFDRHYNASQ